MVSVGTFISLGIIAAVAAGGYAVYRNADKLGGALSRGVETNISNPLGVWFDSLWNGSQIVSNGSPINPITIVNPLPPAYGQVPTPQPPATIPPVPVPPVNDPGLPPSYTNPPPTNIPKPKIYKPGYYYFNFTGSKYDYQTKLTAAQAKLFSTEASRLSTDAFENIKFLGLSKLGPSGLKLFAQSQNYL